MSKLLSLPEKRRILELIIQRDGGMRCLYCKRLLTNRTFILEHLDGDNTDNRLDNLALACQSCNIKKITDTHLQDLALVKLEMNERGLFVGEKFLEKITLQDQETNEASKEIEINTTNYDITEKYLTKVIETEGKILYSDALDSSVYLCRKKGHGSHQSVRNYIASLTSSEGPFQLTRDEKNKKVIIKRVLLQ